MLSNDTRAKKPPPKNRYVIEIKEALSRERSANMPIDMHVLGKQWMWKAEHPGGQREINALHVPVGGVVRLTMQSADVIHSCYVPAFRIKHDVVPGLTRGSGIFVPGPLSWSRPGVA